MHNFVIYVYKAILILVMVLLFIKLHAWDKYTELDNTETISETKLLKQFQCSFNKTKSCFSVQEQVILHKMFEI